jgi:hypothetical protein
VLLTGRAEATFTLVPAVIVTSPPGYSRASMVAEAPLPLALFTWAWTMEPARAPKWTSSSSPSTVTDLGYFPLVVRS